MTHWHEPLPAPNWNRCCQCGKPTMTHPSKVRGATCNEKECNLAEDRAERHRVMTPEEHLNYCRAVAAYFDRPEDESATQRPLKAPKGLTRISPQLSARQEFERAARENDEKMAMIERERTR